MWVRAICLRDRVIMSSLPRNEQSTRTGQLNHHVDDSNTRQDQCAE